MTPASKLVLMILADYHNDELGYAWPSHHRLAEDCGIGERTVGMCLTKLEALGFITTLHKGNQYQPTRYRLNFDFASSQSYALAKSELAKSATAPVNWQNLPVHSAEVANHEIVNRQSTTSEVANLVCTSLNRASRVIEPSPSLLLLRTDFPEWFKILSEDPRWHGKDPDRYIKAIEKGYPGINLELEAHNAYEWLQSTKGRKKKVLRGFWLNWLKHSQALEQNQNGPTQPSAVVDPTAKFKRELALQEQHRRERAEAKAKGLDYDPPYP